MTLCYNEPMNFPTVTPNGKCSLCGDYARDCSCTECPNCERGFIDGDELCPDCDCCSVCGEPAVDTDTRLLPACQFHAEQAWAKDR